MLPAARGRQERPLENVAHVSERISLPFCWSLLLVFFSAFPRKVDFKLPYWGSMSSR